MNEDIVVANWKMNKTVEETEEFCNQFLESGVIGENIVICPSFTSLAKANALLNGKVKIGAQNMHWEEEGTFTGEVSPLQLKDLGCEYVILGHSERRWKMMESNDMVSFKVGVALKNGLKPIICIGEKREERAKGETNSFLENQLKSALERVEGSDLENIVITYEPVWAIGRGDTDPLNAASPKDVAKIKDLVHSILDQIYGEDSEEKVRFLYGGSVDASNVSDFTSIDGVDGVLVGGASLQADDLIGIIKKVS